MADEEYGVKGNLFLRWKNNGDEKDPIDRRKLMMERIDRAISSRE